MREEIGLTNVIPMLPFVRTLGEADKVLAVMAQHGLKPLARIVAYATGGCAPEWVMMAPERSIRACAAGRRGPETRGLPSRNRQAGKGPR